MYLSGIADPLHPPLSIFIKYVSYSRR